MNLKTYNNITYGPYQRNVLDAYLVEKDGEPTPVLVYFHGGGYIKGDKSEITYLPLMQECLEAGISVITCNYRFITNDPYPAPMQDGTRAIQFVRSMAAEWNLDPSRIASGGSSAGGHLALWNALRGDLSLPDSADPIERYSSEVAAIVGSGTQASKDQRFYEGIYEGPLIQQNLTLFFGIPSFEELYTPACLRLAEQASAINHMSENAPPAFMSYSMEIAFDELRIPADASANDVIHHPMHGYMLKQRYEEYGIPFVFRHIHDPVRPGERVRFLLEHIG
jgi:acetyl esterase